MQAVAKLGNQEFKTGYTAIAYPHIETDLPRIRCECDGYEHPRAERSAARLARMSEK